jgi:hypothetical protein
LDLTFEIMPLGRAVEMIERGEIVDSKTICGILLTQRQMKNWNPERTDTAGLHG